MTVDPNNPNNKVGTSPGEPAAIDEATKNELVQLGGNYSQMQVEASNMGFASPEAYQKWLKDEAYRNIQNDEDLASAQGHAPPTDPSQISKPPVQQPVAKPNLSPAPAPAPNQPAPRKPIDPQAFAALLEAQNSTYELNHLKNNTVPPYSKAELQTALTGPAAAAIGSLAKEHGGNVWTAAEKYLDLKKSTAKPVDAALEAARQAGDLGLNVSVAKPPNADGSEDAPLNEQIADEIAPAVGGFTEKP